MFHSKTSLAEQKLGFDVELGHRTKWSNITVSSLLHFWQRFPSNDQPTYCDTMQTVWHKYSQHSLPDKRTAHTLKHHQLDWVQGWILQRQLRSYKKWLTRQRKEERERERSGMKGRSSSDICACIRTNFHYAAHKCRRVSYHACVTPQFQ